MIKTYGERYLNVNIGLERQFPWVFVVADFSEPIIGADFLQYFNISIIINMDSSLIK